VAAAQGDRGQWDPGQYNRFAAEREQPFWDLAALLQPVDSPRLVDLGCGDGRLTAALGRRLGAGASVGVDSSPSMLADAAAHAGENLTFLEADIAGWEEPRAFDVVFSNAALQWVPDHEAVLRRWTASLSPGGQLAVQMPANADHPSHQVSSRLAEEWLGTGAPDDPVERNVLPPERYAEVLYGLGFTEQHVRLQVYGHVLTDTAEVVEWVKGTSLTRFKRAMGESLYERFLAEYRRRLLAELGEQSPFFYPFKRILLWGRL
jgi:trans-aconitate 2-methyltransferase